MKGGTFLFIKKPTDPENEVTKYKHIDATHVEWYRRVTSGFVVNSVLFYNLASCYYDSKIQFAIENTLEHLTNILRFGLLSHLRNMIILLPGVYFNIGFSNQRRLYC